MKCLILIRDFFYILQSVIRTGRCCFRISSITSAWAKG